MGTNYYWHEKPKCEHCGRQDEGIHIGKSSAGWCFALRIHPYDGITDLPHWQERYATGEIRNEYGELITPAEMTSVIVDRSWPHRKDGFNYQQNHAEPGPNGLSRHSVGRYCAGHGAGTWDLIEGEFS